MASIKVNQTNQQQHASEANRRVQYNKQIGVRTLLKGNQQIKSKQQPSNPIPTSREKLQSAAHRYDKKFQDLVEEVNTKQRLGYKIIEESDRPNKLKVLYQQTAHLLEEKLPKQQKHRNELASYPTSFVKEHLKEARKCKASLNCIQNTSIWLQYVDKTSTWLTKFHDIKFTLKNLCYGKVFTFCRPCYLQPINNWNWNLNPRD